MPSFWDFVSIIISLLALAVTIYIWYYVRDSQAYIHCLQVHSIHACQEPLGP